MIRMQLLLTSLFVIVCGQGYVQKVPVENVAPGNELPAEGGQARGFANRYVVENYFFMDVRGRVSLDAVGQLLRFAIHDRKGDRSFVIDLDECGLPFNATSFVALGPQAYLLGGATSGDGRAFSVVVFDPFVGHFTVHDVVHSGPKPTAVSDMALFPDQHRVAVIDYRSGGVFVMDLWDGVLMEVANANDFPQISGMKYLRVASTHSCSDEGGGAPGVTIWATGVADGHGSVGVLAGRTVQISDRDGDGVFEFIR